MLYNCWQCGRYNLSERLTSFKLLIAEIINLKKKKKKNRINLNNFSILLIKVHKFNIIWFLITCFIRLTYNKCSTRIFNPEKHINNSATKKIRFNNNVSRFSMQHMEWVIHQISYVQEVENKTNLIPVLYSTVRCLKLHYTSLED